MRPQERAAYGGSRRGSGLRPASSFVAAGVWDSAPLERALLAEADRLVGGNDAFLVIDDTALPKKGRHSVGVAQQYASSLGKTANSQSLVSVTLASGAVPVMVGLRLFLPDSWTRDPERMARARVPVDRRAALSKPKTAIEEIDRGQNIDVRGVGREVLRRIGLEQAALEQAPVRRARPLGRGGWHGRRTVPDCRHGRRRAYRRDGNPARRPRPIALRAHREHASYRFGDSISRVEQDDDGATVTFASGTVERCDAVIVAEGVGSRTRELVFPGENVPRWMDRQKVWLHERFADAGWQSDRVLAGMSTTDDYYFDVLRQVRMPRWSKGRVVLTGDGAWCATPIAGYGTTLAITGAYVLAQELIRSTDVRAAFAAYEQAMRPMVEDAQGVPKLAPRLANPHSRTGIRLLHGALSVASRPAVRGVAGKLFGGRSKDVDLSRYDMPTSEGRSLPL